MQGGSAFTMVGLQLGLTRYGEIQDGSYAFCTMLPYDMRSNPVALAEYIFCMIQIVIAAISTAYVSNRLCGGTTYASKLLLYTHWAYATVFVLIWSAEVSFVIHRSRFFFSSSKAVVW